MFKRNFERICNAKGVSPSSIMVKCGMAPATYSCWTDSTIPRRSTLLKLSECLEVSIDELLADEPPATKMPPADLSPSEFELVRVFRHLPPASQDALLALAKSYDGASGGGGDNQQ